MILTTWDEKFANVIIPGNGQRTSLGWKKDIIGGKNFGIMEKGN